MMRKTIAAVTAAALALGAAVPLIAAADPGRDRHGKGPHSMSGHHGSGDWHGPRARLRMAELIETYDADGDGSVTQAEVDQWRARRLAEFDAGGDGRLSLDEYEQLWLDAMRERMVDHFQRHDDDGDGQITVEEFGDRTSRLVLMRDINEDGVLNMDDLRRGRDRGPRGADKPAAAPAPEGERQQGTVQQ